MKRSIARWSTALAATAWLAVPATGSAQTPPPPASPTAQQPPKASEPAQHGAAQEHIRQAKAALNDIPAASIPAPAKARINDLKRHLTALEKSAGSSAATTASKTAARGTNWATEVAAIDKTLTELLGSATTTGAGEPAAATGTAGTKGAATSKPVTLDETAKSKLMEVRTHVTAFAAAMSGSSSAPSPSPSPSEPQTDPAAAAANQPPASANQPSAAAPSSAMPPSAAAPGSAGAVGAQQPTQPPATPPATADADTAKRHLTAARDALSQLTQLPAAAQLTGDTRAQVSQLITNFNGLVTAKADWRPEYEKVNANLTALIGAPSADQPQTPTSTPGAVGTSGTATSNLDPDIRAKLVEFRAHLSEFEKAAGGGSMASSPSAATPDPSAAPAAATPSMTTPPATAASPDDQQRPATSQRAEAMGQDSAIGHIEAIEAILSGRSAPSSAGNASITLDRAQLDEIRMHLAELRKAVDKK